MEIKTLNLEVVVEFVAAYFPSTQVLASKPEKPVKKEKRKLM